MSHARTRSILSGGALLTLAILGFMARQFQLGPYDDPFATLSNSVFYGILGVVAIAGAVLLVFAPTSRRDRCRVRLDDEERAVVQVRPATNQARPVTQGIAEPAPRATAGANIPPGAQAAAAVRSEPESHGGRNGWPAAGHPNAAWAEPTPLVSPEEAADPVGAVRTPREQLQDRIQELDRRANNAMVRYGLGQLSGTGYRQVLDRIEQERGKLEQELLAAEMDF